VSGRPGRAPGHERSTSIEAAQSRRIRGRL